MTRPPVSPQIPGKTGDHNQRTTTQKGTTLPYRVPAGIKLFMMLAFGITVVIFRSQETGCAALLLGIGVAIWARIPRWALRQGLRPIIPVIMILALMQAWIHDWTVALELATTTLALVLTAIVITSTTPSDAMLDAISAALGPARRLGVSPERIALAFSLMIGAIEHIALIGRQTREAAKARGLDHSMRAQLSPLVIRTVAHAHTTGEALQARGIGDDEA